MTKRLTRSGNSLALVIDRPLAGLVAEAHEQYGGVFRRFAE